MTETENVFLADIGKVTEIVSESAQDVKQVNRLLSEGWLLLAVHQEARFFHEGYSTTVYILGLPRTSLNTQSSSS